MKTDNPTIVIVEDELIIAMDLKRILMQEGYNVIIYFNNIKLLDVIIEIEKYNPVLVILDINLKIKEFDGISIAQHLLLKGLIPFLYITGLSDKEMMLRIKASRPHGIIVKPFKPIDVMCTVAVVVNNFNYRNIEFFSQDSDTHNNAPFVLKPTLKYIDEHIDQRIDIRLLAELTQWHYMHFIRVFSHYMNVTPYQYILQRKIEKAKYLMLETDQLLTHIASDLSFSSYSNFSTVFKRVTGFTPDVYRKSNEKIIS